MRKILLILSIILLTVTHSQGQSSRNTPGDEGAGRIVRLYPNPATSYVTFELPKGTENGFSIQVYNFLGKKMYETPRITDKVTVTLTDFNRGIYIYHLKDQSGKIIESGKFQVSK